MAYIDANYYSLTYYGISAGTQFNRLAARATDDIDMATCHSIVVNDLDADQIDLVMKACAAQVEFYVQNGDTYNEGAGAVSETIGSYSRSGQAGQGAPMGLCPRAKAYLEQAGLMGRSVRILGEAGTVNDDE